MAAEAELLSAIVHLFESVGLSARHVGLKVSCRKLLGAGLSEVGVPKEHFVAACVALDKLDRLGPEAVKTELQESAKLPDDMAGRVVELTQATTLEEFAEVSGVSAGETRELHDLFQLAADYGIDQWLQFDPSVVRGLAYYTGVVFEGFDRAGKLRAICGGGRYDGLMTFYGSRNPVPCAGFGFGDCVIHELLKELELLPGCGSEVDFVVAAYRKNMLGSAMAVARRLRQAGHTVDLYPPARTPKKAFRYADKVGARRMAFVAPNEWEKGLVRVKDLRADRSSDEKERDVPLEELVART